MNKITLVQMLRTSAVAAAVFLPGLAQAQVLPAQSLQASSGGTVATAGGSVALSNAATVLYNQTANPSGDGDVSQKLEIKADDDQIADDFTVPSGKTWTVSQIVAVGLYGLTTTSARADSENVFLYKATAAGLPGLKIMQLNNVKGKDTNGTFALTLPKPVALKAGTYFVSVQANMNYETQGVWNWEVTNAGTKAKGFSGVIRNPGNGLSTGCTKWTAINSCTLHPHGVDFLFKILGTAS